MEKKLNTNMLEKLIHTYKVCLSGGLPDRCRSCPYKGDACAVKSRQASADFLVSVEQETVKAKAYMIAYAYGEKEENVFCPVFPFKTWRDEEHVHYTKYMAPIYKADIIKGIECCKHGGDCEECPYHRRGCTDIMDRQALAFLLALKKQDHEKRAE